MKFKKITALAAAAAMAAGMMCAVPASAEGESTNVSLGINSVYGLYKNKNNTTDVYTVEDAAVLTDGDTSTGLTVNRNNSGNYVNYVLFGNGTDDIIFNRIDINGDKSVVFGTNDIEFFGTINASTADNSYDTKSGKVHFTQAVTNAGGSVTELLKTSDSNTKDFNDIQTFKYVFVLLNNWETTTLNEITLRNISAAEEPVAKIGETEYTSMDDAMAAAKDQDDNTITLLKDASYSGTNYCAQTGKTTTIKSDGDTQRTLTLTANAAGIFTWNGIVFDNVKVTMPEADEINGNVYAWQKNGDNNAMTLRNSMLTGIKTKDCFSCAFVNDVISSTVTGNTVTKALFSNRKDSTVENSTITGNTATGLGIFEVTNSSTTTVKNSVIKDNNIGSLGDINLKEGSTLVLSGNTEIGSIYLENNGATVKLAADFTGSATIKNSALTEDTVVATVEAGASTAGITVTGLDTDTYELQTIDGKLTIKAKAVQAPEALLDEVEFEADQSTGYTANGNILTSSENIVYGYKADLQLNGTTYNTVKADVKAAEGGDVKTKEFTGATVSGNTTVTFYIVANKALDTSVSKVYCEE